MNWLIIMSGQSFRQVMELCGSERMKELTDIIREHGKPLQKMIVNWLIIMSGQSLRIKMELCG